MASDLLHEALHRHALQSSSPPLNGTTSPSLPSSGLQHLSLSDTDDDIIDVRTPLPTSPTTSHASTPSSSRSSSPSRASGGRKGGAGKPRRDKTKEREKAEANKRTMDPLVKFPGEISGRIFGELGIDDLLSCGGVCKKWRTSQTINYTWYLLLQSQTYVEPTSRAPAYSSLNGLPTWRRADSQQNWAARFASIYRRDDLEEKDAERDENGLTMKEEREAKWAEENEEAEALQGDKVEMRKFYKSLGNSKVKGKTGKGGEKTWDQDGLGGGGDDYV